MLDEKEGILNEVSNKKAYGAFASWYWWTFGNVLPRSTMKHSGGADVQVIEGRDHFLFRDVIHTRKPIASQFDILLEQGEITMDHLIKRNRKGRVSEKGPLFKINAPSLELLFPPHKTYSLLQ